MTKKDRKKNYAKSRKILISKNHINIDEKEPYINLERKLIMQKPNAQKA